MISPVEKRKRLDAVESVIGTHRAEGIRVNPVVEKLMKQVADGEITLDQFSESVARYADGLLEQEKSLAGAA